MKKGEHFALLVGMQFGVVTVESSMGLLQKIENGKLLFHIFLSLAKTNQYNTLNIQVLSKY